MRGNYSVNPMPFKFKVLTYTYLLLDLAAFILFLVFEQERSITGSFNIVCALNAIHLLSVGFSDIEWQRITNFRIYTIFIMVFQSLLAIIAYQVLGYSDLYYQIIIIGIQ